jgi:ribosomal protein S3AE
MPPKTTKVLVKRKKFIPVEIPIIKSKIELIGNLPQDLENRTIKLDLTRQLKGKSVEAIIKIKLEDKKAVGYPIKIKLLPYFIRRMIRKRISYVEDSFETPSQESMLVVKPFLITRKRVSRQVRKTLRNKAKNWLEDYIKEKKDLEIFSDILSNRMQKTLSLILKKTYPLSLCEIRILEIKRPLKPEEIPKIEKKPEKIKEVAQFEENLDQFGEIEAEKIKEAEKEIKAAQKKAAKLEEAESAKSEEKEKTEEEIKAEKPEKIKKPRKTAKKKEEDKISEEKKEEAEDKE